MTNIQERAQYILMEDGIKEYNSNLWNSDAKVTSKKIEVGKKFYSYNDYELTDELALQIVNREILRKFQQALRDFVPNQFSSKDIKKDKELKDYFLNGIENSFSIYRDMCDTKEIDAKVNELVDVLADNVETQVSHVINGVYFYRVLQIYEPDNNQKNLVEEINEVANSSDSKK